VEHVTPYVQTITSSLVWRFNFGGPPMTADARPALAYKAPPAPPPPALSWTGCYVDAGGGYGLLNQDHNTTGPGFATVTTTDAGRGWLGRVGGGCDYQTPLFNNRVVVGVFGDYDFMSLNGTNTPDLINVPAVSPVTFPTKETNAAYVGARIGYLVNPALLTYASGGWTATRFTNSPQITTAFGGTTGTAWSGYSPGGWFLGGGAEYALSGIVPINGLFGRSEYRLSTYSKSDIAQFFVASGAPTGNAEHITPYVQTVASGLVWRFNFGNPVVARD
jgi:outer membrane immunogenic protein